MPRIVAPSSPLSTNSSRAAFRSKSRFASLTAKDQSCGNGIRSFFIHNNVIDWVLYVNRAPCAIANWRGGFSRWIERFVRASAHIPSSSNARAVARRGGFPSSQGVVAIPTCQLRRFDPYAIVNVHREHTVYCMSDIRFARVLPHAATEAKSFEYICLNYVHVHAHVVNGGSFHMVRKKRTSRDKQHPGQDVDCARFAGRPGRRQPEEDRQKDCSGRTAACIQRDHRIQSGFRRRNWWRTADIAGAYTKARNLPDFASLIDKQLLPALARAQPVLDDSLDRPFRYVGLRRHREVNVDGQLCLCQAVTRDDRQALGLEPAEFQVANVQQADPAGVQDLV